MLRPQILASASQTSLFLHLNNSPFSHHPCRHLISHIPSDFGAPFFPPPQFSTIGNIMNKIIPKEDEISAIDRKLLKCSQVRAMISGVAIGSVILMIFKIII